MAMFNSKLLVYQRVCVFLQTSSWFHPHQAIAVTAVTAAQQVLCLLYALLGLEARARSLFQDVRQQAADHLTRHMEPMLQKNRIQIVHMSLCIYIYILYTYMCSILHCLFHNPHENQGVFFPNWFFRCQWWPGSRQTSHPRLWMKLGICTRPGND